jgi:ubiquinone/menaquinone biosynthesis C-methylase UbiE
MRFPDATFDVILSVLCLHNIPDAAGREAACREIARVLKPGGTALIADYTATPEYERAFRRAGLTIRAHRAHFRDALGLMWLVTATK